MQRATDHPAGLGNQLALEYPLADFDRRFGASTQMLLQRQDQLAG